MFEIEYVLRLNCILTICYVLERLKKKKKKHGPHWPLMAWKEKVTNSHSCVDTVKWFMWCLLQIRFRRPFLQRVLTLALFLRTGRKGDFQCHYCHQESDSGQSKFILPPWSPINWISHPHLITFLSASQFFLQASVFSLQSIGLFSASTCGRVMGKPIITGRSFRETHQIVLFRSYLSHTVKLLFAVK